MPSIATTAERNEIINARVRAVTMYAGLLTAVADAAAGSVTELSGNNYARTEIVFDAPSGGVSVNSAAVEFPVPSGPWTTVVGIGIFAAASGGVPRYIDNTITPQAFGPLLLARIPAGEFTVTIGDLV